MYLEYIYKSTKQENAMCGRFRGSIREWGKSGIYRDKTMGKKLMYIPNCDKQNYSCFKL